MMELMIYVAIFGGIALVSALGIAYDERVLGMTCERRERNTVRREQIATLADMRGSGPAVGVGARPHPS